MNSFERADRNDEIVGCRVRGLSERHVAARFGVTARQVRRVMDDYRRARRPLHEIDTTEVIAETLAAYEEAIGELAEIAETTAHDGVRLGAVRARLDAHAGRVHLLQAVGVLPQDLGQLSVEIDVRESARAVIEVFDRRGIPEDVQAEVIQAIEGHPPSA